MSTAGVACSSSVISWTDGNRSSGDACSNELVTTVDGVLVTALSDVELQIEGEPQVRLMRCGGVNSLDTTDLALRKVTHAQRTVANTMNAQIATVTTHSTIDVLSRTCWFTTTTVSVTASFIVTTVSVADPTTSGMAWNVCSAV